MWIVWLIVVFLSVLSLFLLAMDRASSRSLAPYAKPGRVRGWLIARRLGLRCLVCNRRAGYGGRCPNAEHNG